ncbi:MAG TPA: flagellar basal body rod protein FlgC [Thermoanaerobacterales bacterium]|nr:flagellar basal body rod protein FlgC [Thermoanaerobacterales bacterium]
MGLFSSIDISATALTAERLRMDIISNNIANVNTTRTENGQPYRRKMPIFQEKAGSFQDILLRKQQSNQNRGVRVVGIKEDVSPFRLVYDPEHPDADKESGYVKMPNVHIVKEMVDMISASRGYEANVTAINTAKSMTMKALEIGRI